jgi:ABC-2 type transport system ATP-binding protein
MRLPNPIDRFSDTESFPSLRGSPAYKRHTTRVVPNAGRSAHADLSFCSVRTSALCDAVMTDSAAISIEHVTKIYDGVNKALDDVSFDVPAGSIFGLLGPNGAGKSTLINILAGMVNKTSGKASIWGWDIDRHPRNARASIGIVPQEIVFDPFFTPAETLDMIAGLYGVPKKERRTRELLRAVHLEDKADAYARTLSGGMKRRLLVAKAMVHSPPIIVLDEPTAGVDIELRQLLWDYVIRLNREEGVTVVLTTHYLEEAEELCERIAIIHKGELIANEPTRKLVEKTREKHVVLTLDRDIVEPPGSTRFEKVCQLDDRRIEIAYHKDRMNAGEVLALVQEKGFGIVDVTTKEADLEDVFLAMTKLPVADG